MKELVLQKSSLVWLCLVAATCVSWWLGADHGVEPLLGTQWAAVFIIVIAFLKLRFVLQYFMDARLAMLPLRLITEAYPVIVCAAVLLIYLLR